MKFLITSPEPAPPPPRTFTIELTEGQAEGLIAEMEIVSSRIKNTECCMVELYWGLRELLMRPK